MWFRSPKNIAIAVTVLIVLTVVSFLLFSKSALPAEFIKAHKQSAEYRPEWPLSKEEYLASLREVTLKLEQGEIITGVGVENSSKIRFTTTAKFEMTTDSSSQSQGKTFLVEKLGATWSASVQGSWGKTTDYLPPPQDR